MTNTSIPHGEHRAVYAREVQELADTGMPVSQATREVAERHGIRPGTAHAAYYEQRRADRGVIRSRRATGHHHAPPELADLLAELAATQRRLTQQINSVVMWAQQADGRVEERALQLMRAALKK